VDRCWFLEVNIYRDSLGTDHFELAQVRNEFGSCLVKAGQTERAEELLFVSRHFLSTLGELHERTQLAVRNLVELYETLNRPEKAAEYRAMLNKEESE
jgi:hypothetical protein